MKIIVLVIMVTSEHYPTYMKSFSPASTVATNTRIEYNINATNERLRYRDQHNPGNETAMRGIPGPNMKSDY